MTPRPAPSARPARWPSVAVGTPPRCSPTAAFSSRRGACWSAQPRRALRPGDRYVQPDRLDVHRSSLDTATLLADGRVLIAGGEDARNTPLASAEVYDPKTGTFSLTGSMATAWEGQEAVAFPDGRVLLVGGERRLVAVASAELYDQKTGQLSEIGSMSTPRRGHTATLLRRPRPGCRGLRLRPAPPDGRTVRTLVGCHSRTQWDGSGSPPPTIVTVRSPLRQEVLGQIGRTCW